MNHFGSAARQVAREGEFLRVVTGSKSLGTGVAETDDSDSMGICLEPLEYVAGLKQFEQYIYRTQPEGVRSGPGDEDLVVYSLRKWLRLALQGNPSVITPLFAPEKHCIVKSSLGDELRSHADWFVSREAGKRFLGYLVSQKERLLDVRGGKHTNRPELVEKYGFDTKYAYHAVRLGLQGVELLTHYKLTLPLRAGTREYLLSIRTGKVPYGDVIARIQDIESDLRHLTENAAVPQRGNTAAASTWCADVHLKWWTGG